ncbi:MAG: ABC transporter ATP-binding protein [Chloroflexi bacterium]|nr:ABC transporter ATP-binding protein [Chloroflexota bacterium]
MLALEGVTYRYAGAARPSLHEVDLSLAEGEVVGVVGASESGKSTLCLVASGLAPRATGGTLGGRLLLDGEDAAGRPMHELAGSVGICFQNPTTQLSGVTLTVYEEVAFGPMNLGVPRDEVIARTEAALDAVGILQLADREPSRISGGQMQLVAIAGLLAMGPRHLVLDEPTAQLDPFGTRLVSETVAALAAEGASILIAEQKTDLLARICTRVMVLEAGRVLFEGTPDDVFADPRLVGLGVPEPSAVRLGRALRVAGLDPSVAAGAAAR